jgi:hypothetical protein
MWAYHSNIPLSVFNISASLIEITISLLKLYGHTGSEGQKPHMCFLSYVEYRPNTNVVILWKTGHTKREVTYKRVKEEYYEDEYGWYYL